MALQRGDVVLVPFPFSDLSATAELVRAYPTLRAEDVANAWAYVRSHRSEIDRQIEENETA